MFPTGTTPGRRYLRPRVLGDSHPQPAPESGAGRRQNENQVYNQTERTPNKNERRQDHNALSCIYVGGTAEASQPPSNGLGDIADRHYNNVHSDLGEHTCSGYQHASYNALHNKRRVLKHILGNPKSEEAAAAEKL